MNLLEILNFSKEYLQKYSFSKPRLESEKVISNVLKLDRITLYAYFDMELSSEQKEKVKTYLKEMARKRIGFDELLKSEDIKIETANYRDENLELLNKSAEYLKKYGVASPKLDAEYIFAHILDVNRLTLTLNFNKKIEEERTKLLLEKKQIVEDMVLEANQNNNLITPIKYTQIESKIEALSILEIKNFIQTLVTAALKPTEESVKEEIEKVIEQPKIQPSPVIESKIEVKRVTKTKYFEVQVTCEEYKALIDYLKEKNIEFKITDGNIKLVEANSNELEDIEG